MSFNPDEEKNMAKKKILICDDDRDFAKLLIMRLNKDFEIEVAVDGLQVMQTARKIKPDCIVLDIHMPGGTAYDIIKKLEDNSHTLTIPIILMSGTEPDFSRLNEFHQKNFIKKPFHVSRLIDLIRQLTGEETTEDETSKSREKF